jgi:hypothetical protein
MSRMKSLFAVLILTAIAGIVPQAQAQTVKVVLVGSSAMWQTLALGAYNDGTSILGGNSFHWTSASNTVNAHDSRPSTQLDDPGTLWVVWDGSATTATNVWAFLKTDSVIGVRCYFGKCHVVAPGTVLSAAGASQISSTLWGADTLLPANVQTLFSTGTLQTAAATDIRPEDALFATCRVNSSLGASAQGAGASDGLDGLGYNSNNASGVCPVFAAATANAKGVGSALKSGFTGTGSPAAPFNVVAFNITGKDPITNGALPPYTVTAVGASPIVFVTARTSALSNLVNVTEQQLQQVFSGTNCNANAFGLPSSAINVYIREPLSGTMNTTEATVFRNPTAYPAPVRGTSQETGVNGTANNPVKLLNCAGGGGQRSRAIGTGEEINSVRDSNTAGSGSQDGIGYAFFSYGNVKNLAGNTNYGYVMLNGVDPIFSSYGSGTTIDPGQPSSAGVLPLNTPCGTGGAAFPCPEWKIWGDETKVTNHYSFPNLRNGTYRAWSLLRVISSGPNNTNLTALVTASQKFVVSSVPDYVPAKPVANTGLTGFPTSFADLGLKLLRSHYQQEDGAGAKLVACAVATGCTNVPEKGGDMGGQIIPTTIGTTTEKEIQLIQGSDPNGSLGPVKRPVL